MDRRWTIHPTVGGALIAGAVALLVAGASFAAALLGASVGARGTRAGAKIGASAQEKAARAVAAQATDTALKVVGRNTAAARKQADLSDLRSVLDDTARHIARATRDLDVLHDRCFTAVQEHVADIGGTLRQTDPVYQRWQAQLVPVYRDSLELRVDRERLRIRLRAPKLLGLYASLEDMITKAREPCAKGELALQAPGRTQIRLSIVRNRTTRYFDEVVRSAGTLL
jgi:hypothetical protein